MNKEAMKPSNEELTEALKLLFKINPKIGRILGWTMACFIQDQIIENYGLFPILSLSGEPGSGKTAVSKVVSALHGNTHDPIIPAGNTQFAITRKITDLPSPVIIDQLNPKYLKKDHYWWVISTLKGIYKGAVQIVGTFRGVKGKKPIVPCVVITETPLEEDLKERCIEIKFDLPDRAAYKGFRLLGEIDLLQFAPVFKKQASILTNDQVKKWLDKYDNHSCEQYNGAVVEVGLLFLRHVIKQLDLNCVRQFNDMKNYTY